MAILSTRWCHLRKFMKLVVLVFTWTGYLLVIRNISGLKFPRNTWVSQVELNIEMTEDTRLELLCVESSTTHNRRNRNKKTRKWCHWQQSPASGPSVRVRPPVCTNFHAFTVSSAVDPPQTVYHQLVFFKYRRKTSEARINTTEMINRWRVTYFLWHCTWFWRHWNF